MAYFECNLERKAPEHLYWEMQDVYENVVKNIYTRTEKLNKALTLTGMKPETFHLIVSGLFKNEEKIYGNVSHFDSMSPEDIADYARLAFRENVGETRLTFPNADVIFDTAFATVKEWEILRHIGIGGSDSAVISDLSEFKTKRGLYYDKIGLPVKLNVNAGNQSVYDRGHAVEDNVIGAFCKLTGAVRIRDTRMFRSKTHPHCIADIDAILRMPDGKLNIFEAKTTVAENQNAWRDNQVPPYYLTQCRHYPAVLDDDRISGTYIGCLFVVDWKLGGKYIGSQYDEDSFVSRFIERDKTLEEEQMEYNEKFWRNFIEGGIEPPVSDPGGKALSELRSIIGPADTGLPPMELTTTDNISTVERMLFLKDKINTITLSQIKPLQTEYDSLKYNLISQLGPVPDGIVALGPGNIWEVRYRPSKKTEFDTELLKTCYPDIYEKVVHVNPDSSRRFSLERLKTPGLKITT